MPLGFGVLIRAFLVRRKNVRNISSMSIGVASLRCRLWLLQAATHQNLIRSPQLGCQNGGLAVIAKANAKLSFNSSRLGSVPVYVGSSGDQSVLLRVPGLCQSGVANQTRRSPASVQRSPSGFTGSMTFSRRSCPRERSSPQCTSLLWLQLYDQLTPPVLSVQKSVHVKWFLALEHVIHGSAQLG